MLRDEWFSVVRSCGVMAQWLERRCAIPETLGSIPSCAAWIFTSLRPSVSAFFVSTGVLVWFNGCIYPVRIGPFLNYILVKSAVQATDWILKKKVCKARLKYASQVHNLWHHCTDTDIPFTSTPHMPLCHQWRCLSVFVCFPDIWRAISRVNVLN